MTGCEFPRLQLRGSAGFPPASLLTAIDENARTKEIEKERKTTLHEQRKEECMEVYLKLIRCATARLEGPEREGSDR